MGEAALTDAPKPPLLWAGLATLWVLIWTTVALLETVYYIHNPRIPAWEPIVLTACATAAAVGWLAGWIRSGQYERITLADPKQWFLRALRWLPALIIGGIGVIYGLRHAIFALAGASYGHLPWLQQCIYEAVKIALFYGLWLGLALGARSFDERSRRHAVVIQPPALQKVERLLVPERDGFRTIDIAAILWLAADDNYVHLHTGDHDYLLRRSLQELLTQLGEQRFARIHKSTAVNVAEIQTLAPLFKGDYEVQLRNGQRLRLSRRYRDALFARLGR